MPVLFRARLGPVKCLIDHFSSNKPYGKSSTRSEVEYLVMCEEVASLRCLKKKIDSAGFHWLIRRSRRGNYFNERFRYSRNEQKIESNDHRVSGRICTETAQQSSPADYHAPVSTSGAFLAIQTTFGLVTESNATLRVERVIGHGKDSGIAV
ncbi:hypothetical protein BT96DRAFT_1010863 [Gymnopus androsaceus JB14]|uniref:Uncharacterized protein n=1 Tax=Gymnopus androsaceus JB14 TaxID=1447944 RepID=A0A6A4GA37_9AGAR|nr:hypothetical protein BT96DRAFT_1010863 [Gymnopus androsaceus JB14]